MLVSWIRACSADSDFAPIGRSFAPVTSSFHATIELRKACRFPLAIEWPVNACDELRGKRVPTSQTLRNRDGTIPYGEAALPNSFRPCDRSVTATVTLGHMPLPPSDNLKRFSLAHPLLTPWVCGGS
jgi:hypothetical protein